MGTRVYGEMVHGPNQKKGEISLLVVPTREAKKAVMRLSTYRHISWYINTHIFQSSIVQIEELIHVLMFGNADWS